MHAYQGYVGSKEKQINVITSPTIFLLNES